MYSYPFEFTIDASGSPDDIQLPSNFPSGMRTIVLKPPSGHAWTFYGQTSTGYPLSIDETYTIRRTDKQPEFQPLEIIGRGALDTGSGTGNGIAS